MERIADVISVRFDFQDDGDRRKPGAALQLDPISRKDLDNDAELRRMLECDERGRQAVARLEGRAAGKETEADRECKQNAKADLEVFAQDCVNKPGKKDPQVEIQRDLLTE